jgi:hypothetical protein
MKNNQASPVIYPLNRRNRCTSRLVRILFCLSQRFSMAVIVIPRDVSHPRPADIEYSVNIPNLGDLSKHGQQQHPISSLTASRSFDLASPYLPHDFIDRRQKWLANQCFQIRITTAWLTYCCAFLSRQPSHN